MFQKNTGVAEAGSRIEMPGGNEPGAETPVLSQ